MSLICQSGTDSLKADNLSAFILKNSENSEARLLKKDTLKA